MRLGYAVGLLSIIPLFACSKNGEEGPKAAAAQSVAVAKVATSAQPVLQMPVASAPASAAGPSDAVKSRAFTVRRPSGSSAGKKPLILALHGFGASAEILNKYVPIAQLADQVGALLVTPSGTFDSKKRQFWNATDACCNFDKAEVNDVEYLGYIIDEAIAKYDADPARVFVIGYSNGGFMAHRLACELSEKITAIASVSGSTFASAERCTPKRAVAVLQIHGDADPSVRYEGGHTVGRNDFPAHPSAQQTVTLWANINHCKMPLKTRGTIDIEEKLPGAETVVNYFDGCQGGAVELWTVQGGAHAVGMKRAGLNAIWVFLSSAVAKTATRPVPSP